MEIFLRVKFCERTCHNMLPTVIMLDHKNFRVHFLTLALIYKSNLNVFI